VTDPGVAQARVWRRGAAVLDHLAVEAPLAIEVNDRDHVVLMRTPGEDLDLAAGFLASEGIIDDRQDLTALLVCTRSTNRVRARLADGIDLPAPIERPAMAGCGVCGRRSIEDVLRRTQRLDPCPAPSDDWLEEAPELLTQPRFALTGGLHGAVLCDPHGQPVLAREDVGRHNAVDKVLGACLRVDRWPLTGHRLVVSSRAGFEIVHKALMARIAVVVCVGAASSLAHDLAQASGLQLYSFARGGRFNAHQEHP
jgi:FdhD protein